MERRVVRKWWDIMYPRHPTSMVMSLPFHSAGMCLNMSRLYFSYFFALQVRTFSSIGHVISGPNTTTLA